MDVLITLLSMGVSGYKKLCKDRKELFATLKESMQTLATKFGERIMDTRKNPISIGKDPSLVVVNVLTAAFFC